MPRRANLHVGAFEKGWHQRVALSQKGGINFCVGGIRWHQGGIRFFWVDATRKYIKLGFI